MDETADYVCPSCGETITHTLDPSAGANQEYVEDCPVCCRPIVFTIAFDRSGGATVTVAAEGSRPPPAGIDLILHGARGSRGDAVGRSDLENLLQQQPGVDTSR